MRFWVFQITERDGKAAYLEGVRKCISLVVVAPLAILVVPVYALLDLYRNRHRTCGVLLSYCR